MSRVQDFPFNRSLLIADGSAHSVGAVYIVGVVNNCTSAQTVTLAIYDNLSSSSGTAVASIAALGATQVITFPAPGIPLSSGGLTALASGSPTAPGIQIIYR